MRLSINYSMMTWLLVLPVTLIVLSVAACSGTTPRDESAVLKIVTTSNFIADWARNVGGDRVEVFSLMPADADPHSFRPGAQDVTRVADADLVISVGLSLEAEWLSKLLDNASLDSSRVIELGKSIDPIVIADDVHDDKKDHREEDEDKEGHGEDHEGHGVADPHFWLDPLRVKLAVALIEDQMSELDPDGAGQYRDRSETYMGKLDELHSWTLTQIKTVPNYRRRLATTHDGLRYFAELYGFILVGATFHGSIHGHDPSAEEIARIVDRIAEMEVPAVFVEAARSDSLASAIAEETGAVIVPGVRIGSLGPADSVAATYVDMLRSNVKVIVGALK